MRVKHINIFPKNKNGRILIEFSFDGVQFFYMELLKEKDDWFPFSLSHGTTYNTNPCSFCNDVFRSFESCSELSPFLNDVYNEIKSHKRFRMRSLFWL